MTRDEITSELFRRRDEGYAALQRKILPTVPPERIIGVRTPELRAMAKELRADPIAGEFLQALPHEYFDENQLHAFLISGERDFGRCMEAVEVFLPYIDNWATCDQLFPKAFKKDPEKLLEHIRVWLASERVYTVRFAMGMLMEHFLDEKFRPEYADMVAAVRSEEYYVNMMAAWYFATALAKQYEQILPYIEERRLSPWTHNKAIQKSVESYRITPEQKAYLKTMRIPRGNKELLSKPGGAGV